MNLPYIQSEIFRELVGLETLLKPEYSFNIYRYGSGKMMVFLYQNKKHDYIDRYKTDTSTITTHDQITAEINRIWQEIPAECKKEL